MTKIIRKYYWCLIFFVIGGCIVSTLAYNVMGRAVGFENVPITSLVPGFCIGSISAFVISFLVIRNRNLLLERLAAEQKIASDLKSEIVQRRKVEAALQISKEDAELANRTKSEFLANMGHELRTPLNAIIGFSDMIRGQEFGPVKNTRYLEYLEDINQAGNGLLNIINDILDLSKIEAGKAELREDVVSVSQAIDSCMLLMRERAVEKGVTLSLDLANGPSSLYADEQKLKQILINLLSNSIKFTPVGGEVTLRSRQDQSGYLLQVADSGIGIAPDDIPIALSAFRQVDSDLNRSFEGTGLGLPLCKSLTEIHGGSLEVQSEVGVGTTVTVRLPTERIVAEKSTGTHGLSA